VRRSWNFRTIRASFDIVGSEIRPDQDIAPVIEPLKGRAEALDSALNYRPPASQTFAPLARHLDEIMPMQ